MRIRQQINPLRMNYFHQLYPWLPNEQQVRPSDQSKFEKFQKLNFEISKYVSEEDYILHSVFKLNTYMVNGKIASVKNNLQKIVFSPNIFPYQVPKGTNHYIIWYHPNRPTTALLDITNELKSLLGNDNFDFVFYENPKMSLKTVYHLQVFWKSD